MTELVMRNFDKTVLDKLNLSGEAREVFRKLLAGRVVENKRPQGRQKPECIEEVEKGVVDSGTVADLDSRRTSNPGSPRGASKQPSQGVGAFR